MARVLPECSDARRAAQRRARQAADAETQVARLLRIGALALAGVLAGASAFAQMPEPTVQRGLAFVRANCARCHAIDKVSLSPLAIAPPFRDLHKRYPIDSLQEAFAEGIQTAHQNMPVFRLDPDQIGDVIAYLKTLEK